MTAGTTAADGADGSPWPIQVALSAPYSTISWDERDPERQRFPLPLLYLHRERAAASETDRTLELQLAGLAGGSEVEIEALSHHANVSTGQPHIVAARFALPRHPCTSDEPCTLQWTFDASATPSDLYTLRVKDSAGETLWESAQRPALALLDTWDVELGAGYSVRVTYGTLFPFAQGERDLAQRLSPEAVTDFVETQFVPIIRETWQTQAEAWGLGRPLHPDWDADKVVEVIVTAPPFALFEGTGTYTFFEGDAGRFHSTRRIWWLSNNNSFQGYDTLENAYKALFPHEFYHLMQWNILLLTGRPSSYWDSWREGQATIIPSIQYPELELSREHLRDAHSTYSGFADRFLSHHLDTSYRDLESDPGNWYDNALYWRFLYEQYDDVQILRAALEEMAQFHPAAQMVQDDVGAMQHALNAAFTRVDGPFRSFEESLVAFARANYGLRLANGRCAQSGTAGCAGLHYDPEGLYAAPSLEAALEFEGAATTFNGTIPGSFGSDFVEVSLDLTAHGEPLTIQVQGNDAGVRFRVQVWRLAPGIGAPRAVTPAPELVPQNGEGTFVYAIPAVDWRAYNRLAVIITRVDANENEDPLGAYQITFIT